MPLPFLAAIPALIAAASTTTLVVGGIAGAAVALGTIVSVSAFIKKINERKKAVKATEAKIAELYRKGDYAKCNIGLRDKKGRTIETIECEVKDSNNELRVGMII